MTREELLAWRAALEATLPGYVPPAAYGIGVVGHLGAEFVWTNTAVMHQLPAIVLASVLGYRSGTCTLAVTVADIDAAIEVLAPAEACDAYDHPNLWSWREVRAAGPVGPLVAVFIGDRADRAADDHQRAFRTAAGW